MTRLLLAASLLLMSSPWMHGQTPAPANAASAVHPGDGHMTDVVRYGGTDAAPLTMDRYAAAGPGPHPAVLIIHGGGFTGGTSRNGSEAYCAEFLAPAGYEVFSINYRLAPGVTFANMEADVARSIRFVRHHASRFNVDPGKIAVVGGSAGGFLSNMAGLQVRPPDRSSPDPVDHERADVQAVVTLFGISSITTMPDPTFASRNGLVREPISLESLNEASPISFVHGGAPPFLFIHGDHDEAVPFGQSLELMDALARKGVKAELITIPNGLHATNGWSQLPGVPDWELEMTEWLNRTLGHTGPVGAGIQPRPVQEPNQDVSQ